MIKIEDVEVIGMRKAIKGMRNSMNSLDKSDSYIDSCIDPIRHCNGCPYEFVGCNDSDYFFSILKSSGTEQRLQPPDCFLPHDAPSGQPMHFIPFFFAFIIYLTAAPMSTSTKNR